MDSPPTPSQSPSPSSIPGANAAVTATDAAPADPNDFTPPTHSPKEDNYYNLVTSFCDLLLVSIHTILYERQVYPNSLFIAARKYNYPVRQARHPKVCQWIQDAVKACKEELLKCTVKHISIPIISPNNIPLERFVFDVSSFPVVPIYDIRTPFFGNNNHEEEDDGDDVFISGHGENESMISSYNTRQADLEEQYRAALTKLTYSCAKLGDLPPDCTFSVAMELRDGAGAPDGDRPSWVAAEQQKTTPRPHQAMFDRRLAARTNRTIPVRALSVGVLALEIWIEEAQKPKS